MFKIIYWPYFKYLVPNFMRFKIEYNFYSIEMLMTLDK